MLVVDNLFADIDRSSVEFERFFNGHNGAIDAGAIPSRRS
jgi:hypothetical protein